MSTRGYTLLGWIVWQIGSRVAKKKASQNRRKRMGLKLEAGDHAEISAASAERPEEVLVLRSAGGENLSIGGYDLRRQQIVDGHSVLTNEPANPASKGQAADPCLGHNSARDGKTEDMRFPIDVAQSCSAFNSNLSGDSIHEDGAHSRQIDDQPIVTNRAPAYVVSAAPYRRQ